MSRWERWFSEASWRRVIVTGIAGGIVLALLAALVAGLVGGGGGSIHDVKPTAVVPILGQDQAVETEPPVEELTPAPTVVVATQEPTATEVVEEPTATLEPEPTEPEPTEAVPTEVATPVG